LAEQRNGHLGMSQPRRFSTREDSTSHVVGARKEIPVSRTSHGGKTAAEFRRQLKMSGRGKKKASDATADSKSSFGNKLERSRKNTLRNA